MARSYSMTSIRNRLFFDTNGSTSLHDLCMEVLFGQSISNWTLTQSQCLLCFICDCDLTMAITLHHSNSQSSPPTARVYKTNVIACQTWSVRLFDWRLPWYLRTWGLDELQCILPLQAQHSCTCNPFTYWVSWAMTCQSVFASCLELWKVDYSAYAGSTKDQGQV